MVQRQAGGAGLLNDRRAIMKGRKRGEQVYEICHPLFLFLNCAQSLQPPAVAERAQHGR